MCVFKSEWRVSPAACTGAAVSAIGCAQRRAGESGSAATPRAAAIVRANALLARGASHSDAIWPRQIFPVTSPHQCKSFGAAKECRGRGEMSPKPLAVRHNFRFATIWTQPWKGLPEIVVEKLK